MPSSDIYLYDSTLSALPASSQIEFLITDRIGKTKHFSRGGPLLVGFGLTHTVGGPIDVFIDDAVRVLAPLTVSQVNGSQNSRMDLLLLTLPSGAGTTSSSGMPTVSMHNTRQVNGHIQQMKIRMRWSDLQAEAVSVLHHTTISGMRKSQRGPHLDDLVGKWCRRLKTFGILDD